MAGLSRGNANVLSKNLDKFEFLQATSLGKKRNEAEPAQNTRRLADVSQGHSFRRPPYIHSPLSQRERDEQGFDYEEHIPLYLPSSQHYPIVPDAVDMLESKRKGSRRPKPNAMGSFRYGAANQLGDPQKNRKKRSIYAKIKEFQKDEQQLNEQILSHELSSTLIVSKTDARTPQSPADGERLQFQTQETLNQPEAEGGSYDFTEAVNL